MGRSATGAVTAGEYLEAVVGDDDRVLELCRALAIGSDGRPVVVPHAEVPRPDADHRLDGERHPWAHRQRAPRVVVVEHLDVAVELLADAVADECPDDAIAVLAACVSIALPMSLSG